MTNVFLTKYQCKLYWRHPKIIRNSVVIPNANVSRYPLINRNKVENNVVFVGSIVPGKNLHLLLEEWHKVVKIVKDSKLLVVGSGNLYCREIKLGKRQIASEEYEELLENIIEKNNIRDLVCFLGLKSAKQIEEEVAPITKVAVVNPGTTEKHYKETFCLSATQFGSFAIPVVGGNSGGLKYTLPKHCGFRVKKQSELSKKIIALLRNNSMNLRYGNNYKKYIQKHFDIKKIESRWIMLLTSEHIKCNRYSSIFLYAIYNYCFLVVRKIKQFLTKSFRI